MKWTILCAGAALAASALVNAAPPQARVAIEKSPDVLRPEQLRAPSRAPVALASTAIAAAAVTDAEVGDADTFGKNVTYLGLGQTMPVFLADDCTGTDPATSRCIIQQPAPLLTTFDEAGLGVMTLPGKATKTLMCFTLTPFINLQWTNNTGAQQLARFNAFAVITIDNSVLNDPALIDPNTGAPFNGSLEILLSTWRNTHTIENGELEVQTSQQSRGCNAGLVSRRQLVETYGLTEALAKEFFKKPMTIHFGASGSVSMSQLTQYFYGIRLYGD